MYGVPADLPLQRFIGQECTLIGIGRFEIRFLFASCGDIHVNSRWEICDDRGRIIDRMVEHAERTSYCIHKIIDIPVNRFEIDPPRSFTLHFENGWSLTIFDDSDQYESFSIHPDRIYV